jgi:multicomponent K+:H+ antiporter subunit E
MRHLLPAPLLSVVLFAGWLLLNGLTAGHAVLGGVLALIIPALTERFRADRPRIGNWAAAVRLGLVVMWDIVVSNLQVARLILGPEQRIEPCFVWLPLDIRDPHGIVSLAAIITMTPGTLSADLTDDRRHLLIHVLNAGDAAALIAGIKQRYEAPLMTIFGDAR